jgi:hypothetical protein
MPPDLFDLSLDELRQRCDQLDAWALAEEAQHDNLDQLRLEVFSRGGGPDDAWNDYHQVRNEFDRRAAEEFDLGQ